MDLFVLQLALIFLPGIIWANIDASYGHKGKPTQFDLVLRSFLFGVASYVVVFLIYNWLGRDFGILQINSNESIDITLWDEVVSAIVAASILALIWLYGSTHKVLTRFLHFISATNTYGPEDVWDYMLNARDAAVEYVHVRDFSTGLTFAGWVSTFSESGRLRELVLRDVIVTDLQSGKELYSTPRVYLAREPASLTLEFPYESADSMEENASTAAKETDSGSD
jgi:Family of unknown function (DUF6338)